MVNIVSKSYLYLKLIRLDKPIGILLLLWPTLWALLLSAVHFKLSIYSAEFLNLLIVFSLGTVLMRSAGCAINDVADRKFDAHVERTANRVIATGQVTVFEALAVATVCVMLSASLALWYLNWFAILLCVPALLVAMAYPFFKRFFVMPQAILGIAFGFGIPIAYAAVENTLPSEMLYLFLANFFWVLSYDTLYAMSDKPDDLKLGLNTSAIFLGQYDVLGVILFKVCFYVLFIFVLIHHHAGILAWIGLLISVVYSVFMLFKLFFMKKTVETHTSVFRNLCFKSFLKNNYVGFWIFLGLLLDLL